MLARMRRKRISFALLVAMQAGAATLENSMEKKLKTELPYDPAIALLGIYPQDTDVLFQRDTCTPMFIAALSTTAKVWKEPKCPLMDEWIKKMWYIYIQWSITPQAKRMKPCHLQLRGWNWRVLC